MMLGCGRDQGPRPGLFPGDDGGGSGGAGGLVPNGGGEAAAGAGQGGALIQGLPTIGELGEPNSDGVRVPPGYSARIIAQSGQEVPGGGGYVWPDYPDGAATFPAIGGGYLYVANSEVSSGGGVAVLACDAQGDVISAYSICENTRMNCQGGVTPLGTFLSCEEVATGKVIECFPFGGKAPIPRPALGSFRHEGLAYDLETHQIYLTEDEPDGRLYRYTPSQVIGGRMADLDDGILEVAKVNPAGHVTWLAIGDPQYLGATATRHQQPKSTPFSGGEGIWLQDRKIYFVTKWDNRVWVLDINAQEVSVLYDASTAQNPILTGVDAILGTSSGELLVSEDDGNMQVVVIFPNGELKPLLQIDGQAGSEVTGIAFDPSGSHFFFSSQRGNGRGITYQMTGPFLPTR